MGGGREKGWRQAKALRGGEAGGRAAPTTPSPPPLPAALFPLSYMQKEGDGLGRVVDVALGVAVPVHSHIALNYVVSDYVPKGARMPARYAVLASTAVMALGAAKLNVAGPGVSATVKKLWATGKDRKEAAA